MNVITVNWHETRKCPPGSLAIGAGYGVCDVLAARGFDRQISWREPGATAGQEICGWIDVRELRELNGQEHRTAENLGQILDS